MDVIGNNIDQALVYAADRAAPLEDSDNGETPYFQGSLLLGKEKLEVYCLKMTEDTPYYYAAVNLHPNMKLGWFKQHWAKYERRWITMKENGMVKLVKGFTAELELEEEEDSKEEPRIQPRKAPAAV